MRRIFILLAGVLGALPAAAQDVLLLRDAQEIRCRVEEVDERSVAYRNWEEDSGPLRRIEKKELVCITYANGEKETFVDANAPGGTADYPWPTVSHPYAVGDLFEEGDVRGIVVQTTDDGLHGVIVSLETRKLAWADRYTHPGTGIHKIEIGCSDPDDGWRNMQRVEEYVQANRLLWDMFPAFAWCRMLGPGWYLPAVNEFRCLASFSENGQYPTSEMDVYRIIRNLNQYCEPYGGTPHNPFTTNLLSSTERTAKAVWHMKPDRAKGDRPRDSYDKYINAHVRAFHRF